MLFDCRILGAADAAAIESFLAPHTPWAYFMRSNIRRGGVEFHSQEYQADYFGAWRGRRLCGLLAHSWIGSVQCFLPDLSVAESLTAAWQEKLVIVPRKIECLLGAAAHVTRLEQSCGWQASDFRSHYESEQLFTLELSAMRVPELMTHDGVAVRLAEARDAPTLVDWRYAFNIEATGATPGADLQDKVVAEIARRIAEQDLYVLTRDGVLKSFCGAGGFLPDWKIIGPVWTPPAERGKGYARTVTAGALYLLRQKGASHAVLFAGNPPAKRAYEALGFRVGGDWKLSFLKQPVSRLPLTARAKEA